LIFGGRVFGGELECGDEDEEVAEVMRRGFCQRSREEKI